MLVPTMKPRAGVAELADAPGLGPGGAQVPWRFEPSRPHSSRGSSERPGTRLDGPPARRTAGTIGRTLKTSVEELPENRVRLEVEVPEADVQHALDHAASELAGAAKIPGFREGKVPATLVVARVGRDALWAEALSSHIDRWFWNAAAASGIRPVAAPEVEPGDPPSDGGSYRFAVTVPVMPTPEVAEWEGLEVPAAEAEVPEELVQAELDALRATVAELVPVSDRPVQEGDTVVLDLAGAATGTQRDYVADVGSGRLIEEIEEALVGMSAGDTKSVELQVDEARTAAVDVTVKQITEKVLPALDDELARSASEFETLAELRADVEARLREAVASELEGKFREDAVDALVERSRVDVPQALVDRRAAELWAGMARSLERRGVAVETYLTMSGQSQEEVVARLRAEAERALKRELVLDAVADRLGIDVTDDEVAEFVREQSEADESPEETIRLMHERGGFDDLRADLRLRRALDEVVAGVSRIPVDLARAREKLWTPEKENTPSGMNIWTPGSEEARAP
jgi:trigger factor